MKSYWMLKLDFCKRYFIQKVDNRNGRTMLRTIYEIIKQRNIENNPLDIISTVYACIQRFLLAM